MTQNPKHLTPSALTLLVTLSPQYVVLTVDAARYGGQAHVRRSMAGSRSLLGPVSHADVGTLLACLLLTPESYGGQRHVLQCRITDLGREYSRQYAAPPLGSLGSRVIAERPPSGAQVPVQGNVQYRTP